MSLKSLITVTFLGLSLLSIICVFIVSQTFLVASPKSMVAPIEVPKDCFLLILILTGPKNTLRRNSIRGSWLREEKKLYNWNLSEGSIRIPRFDSQGFIEQETVEDQQINLLKFITAWNKRRMIGPTEKLNVTVSHRFLIASSGLNTSELFYLHEENDVFGDLMLIKDQIDVYENLTQKLLNGFQRSIEEFNFEYLMKVDDDVFVNLPIITEELRTYHVSTHNQYRNYTIRPELYWGYFNANSPVLRNGKWADPQYFLTEKYMAYALGGGYLLSSNLVNYVVYNRNVLSPFRNEDMAIGAWLSPLRNVHKRHDIRFLMFQKCTTFFVLMHCSRYENMVKLWNGDSCTTLDGPYYDYSLHYFNWKAEQSQCCTSKVEVNLM